MIEWGILKKIAEVYQSLTDCYRISGLLQMEYKEIKYLLKIYFLQVDILKPGSIYVNWIYKNKDLLIDCWSATFDIGPFRQCILNFLIHYSQSFSSTELYDTLNIYFASSASIIHSIIVLWIPQLQFQNNFNIPNSIYGLRSASLQFFWIIQSFA